MQREASDKGVLTSRRVYSRDEKEQLDETLTRMGKGSEVVLFVAISISSSPVIR